MNALLQQLQTKKCLLGDGAMGTALQNLGLDTGQCPELWNIEHRDKVITVIKGYVEAGSDIVETNSFGGSRFKLSHYDLAGRTAELNQAAAETAREAAGNDVLVFGSVGPTGEFLQPLGIVSREEMYEAFKEQVTALAAGGVDAICVETMTALDEAITAVRAVKENTNLPVICTFTFDKTAQGDFRTMMGVSPAQVAEELPQAGADIIGSNCGNGPEEMIAIAAELQHLTDSLLMIQANAGVPELIDGKTVFRAQPEEMYQYARKLAGLGVKIIGGCCGTNEKHIAAMKKAISEH